MDEINVNVERRHAKRVNVSCEFYFRTLGSEQFYDASCIDLSCDGVAFCSKHEFQIDEKIEIQIIPESPIMFSTILIVSVVRIERQSDGIFKVGATIDYANSSATVTANDE